MNIPVCKYSGCNRPIIQGQWGAEGDETFAERVKSGYCRAKCKRLHKPSPSLKDRPTLVADPTAWNYERPEGKEQPKEKRIEDAKYLEWIRSLPCLICGCEAEAHHQNPWGLGGKGIRTHDTRALPLCPLHHTLGGTTQLPGSYHGMGKLTGWKFWKNYGLEIETVIHDLNRAYLESGRKFKEE